MASTLVLAVSSAAAQAPTTPLVAAYYQVKNALVAGDATKAKARGAALVEAIKKFDASKLSAADKKALAVITTDATHISETTEVEHQREHFVTLSKNMITLARDTKVTKAYIQYCPMANEKKGAYWLNEAKDINNPYMGKDMSTCGSVKGTL